MKSVWEIIASPYTMNRLSVSGVGQRKGAVIYTPRQSKILMTTFIQAGYWLKISPLVTEFYSGQDRHTTPTDTDSR